jgi:hypothetical protein
MSGTWTRKGWNRFYWRPLRLREGSFDLTRIRSRDPKHTSPLCYPTANSLWNKPRPQGCVQVTLRLMFSQSAHLAAEPHLNLWPDFTLSAVASTVFVLAGRHLWRKVVSVICRKWLSFLHGILIQEFLRELLGLNAYIQYVHYTEDLCHYRLCTAQYASP